jgi:Transposase DDE domain
MQAYNVTKIAQTVTGFFKGSANKIGYETQFVQRKSPLTATVFAESFVFSCLSDKKVSFEDICGFIRAQGVSITKQGLKKRINEKTVLFFQRLFDRALTHFQVEQTSVFELLKPFSSVKIQDSSGIELPSCLKHIYKGYGGGASESALKLQVLLDGIKGNIEQLNVTAATQNDQSYQGHLSAIKKAALYLQDLGYFCIQSFITIAKNEAYFLSRYLPQTRLFDEQGNPFDLLDHLRQTQTWIDRTVLLGKEQKFPVRFIAQRLDEETKQKRLANIYKSYRRRKPSELILELAGWSIYITNVPDSLLTKEQVHFVYVLRWQIGVSRLRTLHLVGASPTEVKDSSLVAWEASWRESKTMEPSDNILRKEYAQCTRL